jgi:hypothetical protein
LFANLTFCIGAGSPIGVVEHGAASRWDHRPFVQRKAAIEGMLTTNNIAPRSSGKENHLKM